MKPSKIVSIQMLRGLASFSVLFAHMSHKLVQNGMFQQDYFQFCNWGVEIFFLISGFIMMYITSEPIERGKFIIDRIVRIIPLYWSFTIIALIIYLLIPSIVNSSGGDTGILQSFFLLPIPIGTKFLVQNGWTLTYEFLFYFTILLFINKLDTVKFLGVLILFVVVDGVLKLSESHLFVLNPIKYEFLAGISIFFLYQKKYFLASLSLLITIVSIIILHGLDVRPLGLNALLAYIVVASLVTNESRMSYESTWVRVFFWLGEISFSLYLLHPFTIQFTSILLKKLAINNYLIFLAFALISSIAGAYCIYSFFEIKVTRYIKEKLSQPFKASIFY